MNLNEAIATARERRRKREMTGKGDHYSVVQFNTGLQVFRNDKLLSVHKVVLDTHRDKFGGVVHPNERAA